MSSEFHLLDLVSQGAAVQRLLRGLPKDGKIAWLAARGTVKRVESSGSDVSQTFRFESTIGAKCVFRLDGDAFRFAGDHHWFSVPENEA